jgi:ABC-type dipeptide/oligopeptide/nickel transport system permease subunit
MTAPVNTSSSRLTSAVQSLAANRLFLAGTVMLGTLLLLSLTAPALTRWHLLHEPTQPDAQGLDADGMPQPPSRAYLLGTDNLGRDVLARVVYETRVSLTVGVGGMLTATLIGTAVGLIAGFHGGKLDLLLMRFTEMNMTIPEPRLFDLREVR